ncbi:hypothetical protein [Emcibacter nanhaiensis]|uniref:Uncharacterized protein n=1 Tax=Emcibacter nanhaiensis TaxID=1505037 RepID=A0A501PVA0_9PROT|nr:hypothetical protein [Emcibacter nanhaiensis]TPD64007.1 hypothetical protein FIV46_00075 [Emcibacter nanhaiensis]
MDTLGFGFSDIITSIVTMLGTYTLTKRSELEKRIEQTIALVDKLEERACEYWTGETDECTRQIAETYIKSDFSELNRLIQHMDEEFFLYKINEALISPSNAASILELKKSATSYPFETKDWAVDHERIHNIRRHSSNVKKMIRSGRRGP